MGFLSDLKSTVSLSFIFGALFILLIIFLGDFQGIDFFWIWLLSKTTLKRAQIKKLTQVY